MSAPQQLQVVSLLDLSPRFEIVQHEMAPIGDGFGAGEVVSLIRELGRVFDRGCSSLLMNVCAVPFVQSIIADLSSSMVAVVLFRPI